MQLIFTLFFAHGVFHLTHITSNVAFCVVTYQQLPRLLVFMKEESEFRIMSLYVSA